MEACAKALTQLGQRADLRRMTPQMRHHMALYKSVAQFARVIDALKIDRALSVLAHHANAYQFAALLVGVFGVKEDQHGGGTKLSCQIFKVGPVLRGMLSILDKPVGLVVGAVHIETQCAVAFLDVGHHQL